MHSVDFFDLHRKIIIYEGPDRCGKTEQAKELSKRFGIDYFKNSDEHKYFKSDPSYFIHAIRYVDTYFTSFLESTDFEIILDRSWPSEFVYSQALGRKTDFDVLADLDRRHAQLGTVIVIPRRSNYENKKDEYQIINDNIKKIDHYYGEFIKWTKCDVIELNVDDENLDREMTDTINALSKIYKGRKK